MLEELYERGGHPGEIYAIVTVGRVFEFQGIGWEQITGSPTFRLVGPLGSIEFILMRSLHDARIPGLSPEAGRRECHWDPQLEAVTGLEPGVVYEPPSTPALAPVQVTTTTTGN